MKRSDRRYPIQALTEMMALGFAEGMRALKISGSTYQKYRDQGVSRVSADRLAVRAGFHPYEVWPDMADHDYEDASRECEADDCTERFIPANNGGKHRKFCSPRCANRVRLRRYRARSEAARERDRGYSASYYREAKPYVLRRQAAYDKAHREQINARRRKFAA